MGILKQSNIDSSKKIIKDMFINDTGYKEFNPNLYATLGAIEEHDKECYCFTLNDKINIYIDENINVILGDRITADGWDDLELEEAKNIFNTILNIIAESVGA